MKLFFLAACLGLGQVAFAQLEPPNEAGVSMGHLHLNVKDLEAHKTFWVELLGMTPVKLGNMDGVKLPGAIILFRKAEPTGGTAASIVGHIGVKVKDLPAQLAKCKAANIKIVSENERQVMLLGPDGIQVELTQDTSLGAPIINHHIHFYTVPVDETKAWYVKTFGAKPGKRGQFEAADVPGVNLTFSPIDRALAPTKGRGLDHIGFEVANLEEFTKKLVAGGVKFDVPYRKVPALGIAVAFFTDPWGTYIELTEGLDKAVAPKQTSSN